MTFFQEFGRNVEIQTENNLKVVSYFYPELYYIYIAGMNNLWSVLQEQL